MKNELKSIVEPVSLYSGAGLPPGPKARRLLRLLGVLWMNTDDGLNMKNVQLWVTSRGQEILIH